LFKFQSLLDEANKRFNYNSDTGLFTKKSNGKAVGYFRDGGKGYGRVMINYQDISLHRLAWLMHYGEMPKIIDHQDGNQSNNAIDNLRNTTTKGNGQNRKVGCNNTSGQMGVVWHKNSDRWWANIKVDGKRINLGFYIEFSEAVNARKNAEVLYGFHENHGER